MSNKRGIALISVVVIMLMISLIGASLVELISSVNYSSDILISRMKARYLAEAGIAHAVFFLRQQAGPEPSADTRIGPLPLGDGTFTVYFDYREGTITSIGHVNGIAKKLQMQYNVF